MTGDDNKSDAGAVRASEVPVKDQAASPSLRRAAGRRFEALIAAAFWAAWAAPLACAAQPVPVAVTPPDVAMKDPIAADPVFWWRQESFRTTATEPPPSFYWPSAEVAGAPSPFLPAVRPGHESISPAALQAMETWAEAHKSTALIVVHNGRVQAEHYWRGVKADEITNLRAITRSIAPMMLGFGVAEGKVDLDAPLARYIPEWAGDARGKITVRQVAQHVSGLEHNFPPGTVYGNKQNTLFYAGDVVRAALNMDRVSDPGLRFDIADVDVQLLSIVLERATGIPFAQQVSERVWKPIGADGATFQLDRPGGVARTLCCMRATPRDIARLGQLFLQDGKWNGRQVLPAGWVRTMATPSARNPNYGIGLWLGTPFAPLRPYEQGGVGQVPQSEPFLATDVRFMEGGGFRELYIVPSRDLVILRLGYADPQWDNAYLVNTAIRGMRPRGTRP